MSMMGSPGGGGGLSFEDVIGLLKDEPAYQTRLRELQKRTEEARALNQGGTDALGKAEATKKFTADMAAKAEAQLVEARQLKEAADERFATAVKYEKDLAAQHDAMQQQAEIELEGHRQHLRDAFTAREKEVAAKEQDLLAKIKDFEALQADRNDRADEFEAHVKAKEAEFARTEAERKAELDLIAKGKAENEKTRQELKAKLDAIKAITAK